MCPNYTKINIPVTSQPFFKKLVVSLALSTLIYAYSLIFLFTIIAKSNPDSSASWTYGRYVFIVLITFLLERGYVYADRGMSPTTNITLSVMLDN